MLPLRLSYDTFGGEREVMDFLLHIGMLNNVCSVCHQVVPVKYEKGSPFPRIDCPVCSPRPSCATNSALDLSHIRNVPLFLFVASCFSLHVSTKAIMCLTGAHYRTVKKYIGCIQKAMCEKIRKERSEGRMMLGGQGKIVEIDEMFVCGRKYGRGRRMAKEGTWVLGLTEVDAASNPIENRNFLEQLRKREDEREEAARQRQERRKRRKTTKNAVRAPRPIPDVPAPDTAAPNASVPVSPDHDCPAPHCPVPNFLTSFVRTSDTFEVETAEWIDDAFATDDGDDNGHELANQDEEEEGIEIVHVADNVDDEESLSRIEPESQLKRLFSQSRKNMPKKTLFFVLPDRSKETLHRFIVANALPGSTIYTDEWRGYNGLDGSITIPQRNNSATFSFRTILVFCSRRFSILSHRTIRFIPDSSMAFLDWAKTHWFCIVLLNPKYSSTIRLLKLGRRAGDDAGDEKKR